MIGIIANYGLSEQGNEIYYIYKNFYKLDYPLLFIPLTNLNDVIQKINQCQGIIMQGGDDYSPIHLEIIKYLHDKDIPLLAICMSMQAMGVLFGGELKTIKNHHLKNRYAHDIQIKRDTLLFKIINSDKIAVNSFHKFALINTNLCTSAYSDCIEAIEDKSKTFFLGVQWHPEKMVEYDKVERKIFDYFKEVCYGIEKTHRDC